MWIARLIAVLVAALVGVQLLRADSINVLPQTVGTWTPVDASGAALSFTANTGGYTILGNMVFAYGTATYPATADGTAAKIGGLPITVANQNYAQQCVLNYTSVATVAHLVANKNTTNFSIFSTAGAGVTNATLTTSALNFICIYPIT